MHDLCCIEGLNIPGVNIKLPGYQGGPSTVYQRLNMVLAWQPNAPDMIMNLSAVSLTDCQKSCQGLGRHQVQQVWHFMQHVDQGQHNRLTANMLPFSCSQHTIE